MNKKFQFISFKVDNVQTIRPDLGKDFKYLNLAILDYSVNDEDYTVRLFIDKNNENPGKIYFEMWKTMLKHVNRELQMYTEDWLDPTEYHDNNVNTKNIVNPWMHFDLGDELEKEEADKFGLSSKEWQTKQMFNYLDRDPELIDLEDVKDFLIKGIDPFMSDDKGYTVGEIAGLKQRYDVVDLIERSKYGKI